jgi:hypothetical protein
MKPRVLSEDTRTLAMRLIIQAGFQAATVAGGMLSRSHIAFFHRN